MAGKSHTKTPSLTIFTLALPDLEGEGTLLVQRGELAHVRQFVYAAETDFTALVRQALDALAVIESDPPIIADPPPTAKTPVQAAPEPAQPPEPTIDIPLKKGVMAVPISYLKITGGETDAAAYRQAVQIAGKLVSGGLWDGKTPIRFDDVYRAHKKISGLSDKELSLFTLEDFAQRVAETAPVAAEAETQPEILKKAPLTTRRSRFDEAAAARKPVLRWRPGARAEA